MPPAPGQRYESELVEVSPLGQPLSFDFSCKSAQNRFMKAAMTERLSSGILRLLPHVVSRRSTSLTSIDAGEKADLA